VCATGDSLDAGVLQVQDQVVLPAPALARGRRWGGEQASLSQIFDHGGDLGPFLASRQELGEGYTVALAVDPKGLLDVALVGVAELSGLVVGGGTHEDHEGPEAGEKEKGSPEDASQDPEVVRMGGMATGVDGHMWLKTHSYPRIRGPWGGRYDFAEYRLFKIRVSEKRYNVIHN